MSDITLRNSSSVSSSAVWYVIVYSDTAVGLAEIMEYLVESLFIMGLIKEWWAFHEMIYFYMLSISSSIFLFCFLFDEAVKHASSRSIGKGNGKYCRDASYDEDGNGTAQKTKTDTPTPRMSMVLTPLPYITFFCCLECHRFWEICVRCKCIRRFILPLIFGCVR